ncbi:hypothetical protein IW262DRAFT_1466682 [Armillaria fumosa]|nr:hypothetical protein IW262DRAFT_1466682 [Armillaria fumosa]
MAKVYAGFCDYDDATIERAKQQRVPMVLMAKRPNPLEANETTPSDRGKRDSQLMLHDVTTGGTAHNHHHHHHHHQQQQQQQQSAAPLNQISFSGGGYIGL